MSSAQQFLKNWALINNLLGRNSKSTIITAMKSGVMLPFQTEFQLRTN